MFTTSGVPGVSGRSIPLRHAGDWPPAKYSVVHEVLKLQRSPAYAGLSAEATHRRFRQHAGDDDESEADYQLRRTCRVLLWGPTTDNVLAYLFREEDQLVITLEFWREEHLLSHPEDTGAVFVAGIPSGEFIGILEGIAAALDAGWSEPRKEVQDAA